MRMVGATGAVSNEGNEGNEASEANEGGEVRARLALPFSGEVLARLVTFLWAFMTPPKAPARSLLAGVLGYVMTSPLRASPAVSGAGGLRRHRPT